MDQPRWLANAWGELGQREIGGSADNPRIAAFFREVAQAASLHDEVAWCAAFVGACLERAAHRSSTRSLMARSYLALGRGHRCRPLRRGRGAEPRQRSRRRPRRLPASARPMSASSSARRQPGRLRHRSQPFPRRACSVALAAARSPPRRLPILYSAPGAAIFDRARRTFSKWRAASTDDPYDPGGPTNRGITLAVFAAWKGVTVDAGSLAGLKAELQRIPEAAVRDIYTERYWRPASCAEFEPALAFFHFDAAVNHGVVGATRLLQQAVETDADGEIGPLTRAAIAQQPVAETLRAYAGIRRERYRALGHFWRFGRGWLKRVDTTLERALAIAGAEHTTTSHAKGPSDMPSVAIQPKWWGNRSPSGA